MPMAQQGTSSTLWPTCLCAQPISSYVAEGELGVTQKGRHLRHLLTGDLFGELAVLYNCQRTATVTGKPGGDGVRAHGRNGHPGPRMSWHLENTKCPPPHQRMHLSSLEQSHSPEPGRPAR